MRQPVTIVLAVEPSRSRPDVKHRISVTTQIDCECEAARFRPMEYCEHALAYIRRIDAAKALRRKLEHERDMIDNRRALIERELTHLLELDAR